ncbi:MAG: hypothetical protein GTO60_11575 [Gammaproteobacteria bacterium]|nr:hypothetical protein [Gammaproteobacteria bacterium]
MENSSNPEPAQGKGKGINVYILAFALIATLIAGVAIGLLINRPAETIQVVVTATPNPDSQPVAQANEQAAQEPAQNNASAAGADSENDTSTGPPTPTIMDFVLSDARHFQGSADAPVTLIEFSDFK